MKNTGILGRFHIFAKNSISENIVFISIILWLKNEVQVVEQAKACIWYAWGREFEPDWNLFIFEFMNFDLRLLHFCNEAKIVKYFGLILLMLALYRNYQLHLQWNKVQSINRLHWQMKKKYILSQQFTLFIGIKGSVKIVCSFIWLH